MAPPEVIDAHRHRLFRLRPTARGRSRVRTVPVPIARRKLAPTGSDTSVSFSCRSVSAVSTCPISATRVAPSWAGGPSTTWVKNPSEACTSGGDHGIVPACGSNAARNEAMLSGPKRSRHRCSIEATALGHRRRAYDPARVGRKTVLPLTPRWLPKPSRRLGPTSPTEIHPQRSRPPMFEPPPAARASELVYGDALFIDKPQPVGPHGQTVRCGTTGQRVLNRWLRRHCQSRS